MENTKQIVLESNNGLKPCIIGKAWKPNTETNRFGSIKISRSLSQEIVLKAGTTLTLAPNNQREGKQDADFNVSVLLPAEVANRMINEMKEGEAERKEEEVN